MVPIDLISMSGQTILTEEHRSLDLVLFLFSRFHLKPKRHEVGPYDSPDLVAREAFVQAARSNALFMLLQHADNRVSKIGRRLSSGKANIPCGSGIHGPAFRWPQCLLFTSAVCLNRRQGDRRHRRHSVAMSPVHQHSPPEQETGDRRHRRHVATVSPVHQRSLPEQETGDRRHRRHVAAMSPVHQRSPSEQETGDRRHRRHVAAMSPVHQHSPRRWRRRAPGKGEADQMPPYRTTIPYPCQLHTPGCSIPYYHTILPYQVYIYIICVFEEETK